MQKNFVIFIDFSRFLSQTCTVYTIGNHMQLWQNDTGIFFCNVAATGSWKDKNHAHSFIFGAKKGMTSCDSYVLFGLSFFLLPDVLVSFSMKKSQLFFWISNVHLNFWLIPYSRMRLLLESDGQKSVFYEGMYQIQSEIIHRQRKIENEK